MLKMDEEPRKIPAKDQIRTCKSRFKSDVITPGSAGSVSRRVREGGGEGRRNRLPGITLPPGHVWLGGALSVSTEGSVRLVSFTEPARDSLRNPRLCRGKWPFFHGEPRREVYASSAGGNHSLVTWGWGISDESGASIHWWAWASTWTRSDSEWHSLPCPQEWLKATDD